MTEFEDIGRALGYKIGFAVDQKIFRGPVLPALENAKIYAVNLIRKGWTFDGIQASDEGLLVHLHKDAPK